MKSHPVPKEVDDLFAEYAALEKLRDIYVYVPFGYRRAVKAAKESEIKRRSFWQKLYELYPDLRDQDWFYKPYLLQVTDSRVSAEVPGEV
jgi:hypothetical protein